VNIADFRTREQWIEYRVKWTRYHRDWRAKNADKVKLYRARAEVSNRLDRIDNVYEKIDAARALLELPESTLTLVHDTCSANLEIDLKQLENALLDAIARFERAVALLEEEEARHGQARH